MVVGADVRRSQPHWHIAVRGPRATGAVGTARGVIVLRIRVVVGGKEGRPPPVLPHEGARRPADAVLAREGTTFSHGAHEIAVATEGGSSTAVGRHCIRREPAAADLPHRGGGRRADAGESVARPSTCEERYVSTRRRKEFRCLRGTARGGEVHVASVLLRDLDDADCDEQEARSSEEEDGGRCLHWGPFVVVVLPAARSSSP